VRLLLPPGARLESLTARPLDEPQILPGTWTLEHGRRPIHTPDPNGAAPAGAEVDGPDPAIYSSDQPYPSSRAELASVQWLAGHAVAFVRVYPVQYLPTSGTLIFAGRVQVELALAVDTTGSSSSSRR
jgi:hypothetical protein